MLFYKPMFTSKERVLRAVDHEATDRVPVTFDADKEVYRLLYDHFGISSREELFDKLHVDTWILIPKNFIYTDEEDNKKVKTSIWGYQTTVTSYSGGTYDEITSSPLAGKDEIDDIKNYQWPDEDILDFTHFPNEAKSHANRAVIGAFTWGAYFIATFVRGMYDFMADLSLNRKYADYLIKTIAEKSLGYLDRMLGYYGEGTDIVYMADDYCSQRAPLFSPELFNTLVMPYLRKVADRVHRQGKKFLLHVCGAVRPLLPMIIEAGVDILEPVQVMAAGMDPAGLKRDFGDHICFYGGMDLQQVLCKGTVNKVKNEAERLIDILGKNGGYIFGPGHTYIQIDAPLQNILTMYETAFHYRPTT
jgi:uroporphyrinogen decarboxylase